MIPPYSWVIPGISQHVLIRAIRTIDGLGLGTQSRPLRIDEVGRTPGNDLLTSLGLGQGDNLRILLTDGVAVVPQHQVGELTGQHLVRTHDHVEHRLSTHDLAGRRDQRWVTSDLTDPRDLLEHLTQPVTSTLLLKLGLHVGDHPARDLALEDIRLNVERGRELRVTRSELGKMVLDLAQTHLVEVSDIPRALQHLLQQLGPVVTWAQRQRTDSSIDNIGTS